MPKPSTKAEFNTFVGGLVTEASPLNFPQNASADEENFVLNKDGSRNRRLGMKIEDPSGMALAGIDFSLTDTVQVFLWKQPGGVVDLDVLVLRYGKQLKFFNSESQPLLDGELSTLTLGSFDQDSRYQFASVNGVLIVTCGNPDMAVIEYNSGVFSETYFRIKTRDLWGVECYQVPEYETDPKFSSTVKDNCHIYNLHNQSWGVPRRSQFGPTVDPIEGYFQEYGKYPSNSMQVWPALQYKPVTSTDTPTEVVYWNLFRELQGIGPEAAKGYFIIDAVERGASRTQEFTYNHSTRYLDIVGATPSWPADRTTGGATVIAEFAGRIFYAGFPGEVVSPDARSPNLANYIFFSQLVKNTKDLQACYQVGDPTSREESDVVETDGGFLRVGGCDRVLGLLNLGTSLIILGSNGIWSLSGGSDYGFSATNYKLDKISNFGCFSPSSIVEERGRAFYWAETGINVIGRNQLGDFEVFSLTDTTIASYYQSIPNLAKVNAQGVFDPVSKKISWFYNTGTPFTSESEQRELVFDTNLNAFSKMRIANGYFSSFEVLTPFISSPFRSSLVDKPIVAGVDTIIAGTSEVVASSSEKFSDYQSNKYIVGLKVTPTTVALLSASYSDTTFKDWEALGVEGVDAPAFLLTGAMTGGNSSVEKQIPYVTFHFRRTETIVDTELTPLDQSSCKFRCQWNWTNSLDSGRWSAEQQVYRYSPIPVVTTPGQEYTNHSDVISTKNKVRGYGKALAFSLQTEPGKDCQLLGWSINLSGNSYV